MAGNFYLTPLLYTSSSNYHHLINVSTEKALVDRGKKMDVPIKSGRSGTHRFGQRRPVRNVESFL